MNKLPLLILLIFLFPDSTIAQKYLPKIGIGTTLNYNVEAINVGQKVPLTLKIISLNDPMKFHWIVSGLGNGNFLIPVKSLESGTKMRVRVPEPDQDTQYKDDETILFISKATFSDLVKNQSFTLNKTTFTIKPLSTPYLINNQEADVLHVINDTGKIEVWILNNPDFPLICKMTGNPAGFDFDLTSLKEQP